jgi:hypothetical protein
MNQGPRRFRGALHGWKTVKTAKIAEAIQGLEGPPFLSVI